MNAADYFPTLACATVEDNDQASHMTERKTPPLAFFQAASDRKPQDRREDFMDIFRAIYTSRPFGFDSAMLSGILMDARRANVRDGITGALICRADIYLQWLEGPEQQVRRALERIERDDRHLEVKVHVTEHVAERTFGEWSMLHDPAATWIWTQSEIADGALEKAAPEEIKGFFLRLRSGAGDDG